ncbi:hypothetical protein NC651_012183 [Populus alba x Populus x berolinensis]|nr:hypothetical protein NC651_012163 [Populus alba x Populus x berolinensis]KAJ6917901.1 hypothetical protein NC651_012183 [Populus alba x Populus x berolinensis]
MTASVAACKSTYMGGNGEGVGFSEVYWVDATCYFPYSTHPIGFRSFLPLLITLLLMACLSGTQTIGELVKPVGIFHNNMSKISGANFITVWQSPQVLRFFFTRISAPAGGARSSNTRASLLVIPHALLLVSATYQFFFAKSSDFLSVS